MIHDILMSLLAPGSDKIAIEEFLRSQSSEIYVHPCEHALLTFIVSIANQHKTIRNFVRRYSAAQIATPRPKSNDEQLPNGLYVQALANGIDLALKPYTDSILEMEKRYLQQPNLQLTFVYHEVQKFNFMFTFLLKFIDGIQTQRLHGCPLLQYLQQHSLHGSPQITQAIQKVQQSVNTVFLKHLSTWLIYGRIVDVHSEFFIQNSEQHTTNTIATSTAANSARHNNHSMTTTSYTSTTEMWHYEICYEMLPHYFTHTWAENVLFIGQTVMMFNCDPRDSSTTRHNRYAAISKLDSDDETDGTSAHDTNSLTLWNNRAVEFYNRIIALQTDPTLVISKYEQIIDEIKNYISMRLSVIAINQADLVRQLRLIKDFYLIGRGDLFLKFIRQMTTVKMPPSGIDATMACNIEKAFQSAAHSVNVTDDLDQFALYIALDRADTATYDATEPQIGFIQFIEFKYKVKWPLHLLFSPKVIDRYNDMFRFLLKIKKIQYDLHMVWCHHRERKMKKNHQLLQFRNKLMFLVDNLQYYLQVDVLEAQFSILMNAIQQSHDFEHIKRTHIIFQANILSLCFLLSTPNRVDNPNMTVSSMYKSQIFNGSVAENPVLTILNEILQRITVFCRLSTTCSDPMTNDEQLLLESCERLFANHVTDLMKLLTGLKAGPSSAPLAQLLLRLDYNYWFSTKETIRNDM